MGNTLVAYLRRDDVGGNFHESMTAMAAYDAGKYIADILPLRVGNGGDIGENRNLIVRLFLEHAEKPEWLFIVDDDMGFTPRALEGLHRMADPVERPMIGGLCFAQFSLERDGRAGFTWTPAPCLWSFTECADGKHRFVRHNFYPVNGLVRCDGTGAAFVLIHRSVVERVAERFGPVWFDRFRDVDDVLISEDLSFFSRCRELDLPLHVWTGVRTNHQKTTWMTDADFWAGFRPPPATEQVDVIVPVLHRPQNVRPFMESLTASTGLASATFVVEPGDRNEIDAVRECGGNVIEWPGSFADKVNFAWREYLSREDGAPWLLLAGDDVRFHPAWLDHAQLVAKAYEASVVGTNDLGNPRIMSGEHSAHPLIRRDYIDEVGASWTGGPGTVCHPYGHMFVDDEIVLAARQRGVWQMALGSIVEHMHPFWGKADDDEVYGIGRDRCEADKVTFLERLNRFAPEFAA